jgi:hypothetical protein
MTDDTRHLTTEELEARLDEIRGAPPDAGRVELIVRRPAEGERELLGAAELDPALGLAGDRWSRREGRAPNPATQLTIMNARATAAVATERERWALAGDQLYLDLDLSEANLPPGTHLALGSAVIRISEEPHTGCKKFVARFGMDAMLFVNSPVGRSLRLRGVNASVVTPGTVRVGDVATKLEVPAAAAGA